MFKVIGFMFGGMLVGFLLRRKSLSWMDKLISVLIWLLLFVMGVEVGSNRKIIEGLGSMGLEALVMTLAFVGGSCLFAWILWCLITKKEKGMARTEEAMSKSEETMSIREGCAEMRGSLIVVVFFAVGVLCGAMGFIPFDIAQTDVGFYALCALMFSVGLSIGNDSQALSNFRRLNPGLLFLPLATILGTLSAALLVSLILPGRSAVECMAVGSGMGYYSLSSIFITEYKGAELGTLALLSNMFREIITLLCAPLLVRWFGNLAPISAGGATTMDTTLPIITKTSGQQFVGLSVFHGFITDFSVPFLVTLFCSI